MTFIVTLIALLIERFFDWSHIRHWHWYSIYQRSLAKRFSDKSAYLTLLVVIVPILVITGLIEWALAGWLYGFLKLLFELFIVIYCLGPQNLWADAFVSINASAHGEAETHVNANAESVTDQFFIEANHRIFAALFWYAILGPVGAMLYRMLSLSASPAQTSDTPAGLKLAAQRALMYLDWLPIRLFIFILALGGHFTQAFACLRKKILLAPTSNELVLTECGQAALGHEESVTTSMDVTEKNAVNLIDRAFIIFLVLIAIVVLIL